jgi:hypothetical protein
MRRVLSVVIGVFLIVPTAATALPVYNGGQMFPTIAGPEGPEEYAWEVQLNEEQTLELIDDQHAAVRSEAGVVAFEIQAELAHDADGKAVPTTLAVTEPNIITLTVHHRGASFRYPISAGKAYETGFATVIVELPPGDQPPPEPACVVPDLSSRTLRASRKILHAAHCRLGRVRGDRNRAVHVVEQFRQVGKVLPVWTRVDVKALPAAQYSRSS